MNPTRVAVVGAGHVAVDAHLPAYLANADLIDVVAVVDTDRRRRTALAAALGNGPVTGASLGEAARSTDIDLVVVATPPAAHHDPVADALDRGMAVLCEKPLCTSRGQVRSLETIVARTGGYLAVLHNYLYKPGWRAVSEVIASGRIGTPVLARFEELSTDYWHAPYTSWREQAGEGGGPLRDNLYHALYLAEHLLASPVDELHATQGAGLHGYGGGDVALLTLVHQNGALTHAVSAWCHQGRRRAVFELAGTEGCLRYTYWERPGEFVVEHGTDVEVIVVDSWSPDAEWGHTVAVRDAVERFRSGQPPPIGIADAGRLVGLMEGAGAHVVRRAPGAPARGQTWWRRRSRS